MDFAHYSVLLDESIENLKIRPDGVYADGTVGGGGHSEQIAKRLTTGKLICSDADTEALEAAKTAQVEKENAIKTAHQSAQLALKTKEDEIQRLLKSEAKLRTSNINFKG